MSASRRQFLKYFLASAGCFTASSCTRLTRNTEQEVIVDKNASLRRFPQGVASADPSHDTVMLWTRAVPDKEDALQTSLFVQVSLDISFDQLVINTPVSVSQDSDFTVRFFAQGLKADTRYYYRFIHAETRLSSTVGRTRTAPAVDADRRVNFAWACCQNYEHGFYTAWQKMLYDDERADFDQQLDFILHIGDFIYETINAGFRDDSTRAQHGDSPYLLDHKGRERRLPPLPSDGMPGKYGGRAAVTLEDFRHIYKEYLKDPVLQAVRARWPFICIWDDHEFADNCWQSHIGTQAFQTGRVASNQAWFEYVPAVLNFAQRVNGVASEAHDFNKVDVDNHAFGKPNEPGSDERNNQQAIYSLSVYRAFRFGRHVNLILTDNRLYRSDHVVPAWWEKKYFRNQPLAKTSSLVNALEELSEWNTNSGSDQSEEKTMTIHGRALPFPSTKKGVGSMLGQKQKSWFLQSLKNSDATWNLWANAVPLMDIQHDKGGEEFELHSIDNWSGYPVERKQLLDFIEAEKITNVVSLSGDFHAHAVGNANMLSQNEAHTSVFSKHSIPEFMVAALSSVSMYRIIKLITPKNTYFHRFAVGTEQSEDVALNHNLLHGIDASLNLSKASDEQTVSPNPHLKYIDTNANGYGIVHVSAAHMHVDLISINTTLVDYTGREGDIEATCVKYTL